MQRVVGIVTTEEFDGQNLTDEQKALQSKLTEEFHNELKQKLSSFDDINTSIRFFNIIHSMLDNKAIDFTYFNAPGFNFFDSKGRWNKNAGNIMENTTISCDGINYMPHYEAMCAKINGVLYPEILDENDDLTDKEKLILSAVVDQIQSEMSRKYISGTAKLDDILNSIIIDEMIFKATCSSVRKILPELKFLIPVPASFERPDIVIEQFPFPTVPLRSPIEPHPSSTNSHRIFRGASNKFENVKKITIEQFPLPTVPLDSPIEPLPSSPNSHRMFKGASDQNKSVTKKNDDQGGCKCRLF